jgi:hypothetical protein
MAEEKPIKGRPVAFDNAADTANEGLPGFLAKPAGAPAYHGFQILDDVVVDGFTLGLITDFESEGATEGDAFVIAPDNSRAGLVWATPGGPEDKPRLDELCPIEKERWGVWEVFFPFPMANREDARRNLRAVLPLLRPKWEEWRQAFGQESIP